MDFSKAPLGGSSSVNFQQYKEATEGMNKKARIQGSHTQEDQTLEEMYAQCPHLQEVQRARIGDEMRFDSNQVKIWFQYRNQFKGQNTHEATEQAIQNVQHETLFNVNQNNKRKNSTIPTLESSSLDLSQGSLRNRNQEIIVPVQQQFSVFPHLAETYHHNFNLVADQQHIAADPAITAPDQNQNSSAITHAPQQNVSVLTSAAITPQQNVVAYDDTSFLDGNIWDDEISDWLLPVDEDSLEQKMSDLSDALHDVTPVHSSVPDPAPAPPASDNHMATIDENVVAADKDIGDANGVSDGCVAHPISEYKEREKKMIMETANNAMEELTRLLQLNEPFWFRSMKDGRFILQRETYDKMYRKSSVLNGPLARIESSKDELIVSMSGAQLVDMFLNSEKWTALFPTMVKSAKTIEVLEDGSLESRDGALQRMFAKMHILSPLVPTRNTLFLRYCKQIEKGVWVIADVSLSLDAIELASCPPNAWKFPSGCMIQEHTDDSCRVSWVEHIQVDDKGQTNDFFKKTICSNNGYRAQRWLWTLETMCQRISTSSIQNIPTSTDTRREVINPMEGKKIVMKLGERMLKIFYEALDMSSNRDFPELNTMDNDMVRVNVRKCKDPGTENGVILTASCSFWLCCSPEFAFDFLKDNNRRFQWDVLCAGHPVEEIHRITYGTNPGNFTSIIKTLNPKDNDDLRILQECYTHFMESGLVYCPIDTETINCAIRGEDCSLLPLLPSGFTISGDGRPSSDNKGKIAGDSYEGSVVTVAYQMLIGKPSHMENPNLDAVKKMNKFVTTAVNNIRVALDCLDY